MRILESIDSERVAQTAVMSAWVYSTLTILVTYGTIGWPLSMVASLASMICLVFVMEPNHE